VRRSVRHGSGTGYATFSCRNASTSGGSEFSSQDTAGIDGYGLRQPTVKLLGMARWPRHVWTSLFTYGTVFVLFPLLCWLAYAWVHGWIF
jgi:hypothetical protein